MKFDKTNFHSLIVIHPNVHKDDRGYFYESFKKPVFDSLGFSSDFFQDNHAFSK